MKPLAYIAALWALAAAALPAAAHEEPYSTAWCSGGQVTELGTFQIPGQVLSNFRQSPACAYEIHNRDCGVFDDDYHAARSYSAAYCVLLASNLQQDTGAVSIIPVVTGPASFLDDDHHHSYQASSGLSGVCLVCRRPLGLPTLPTQPNNPVR